MSDDNDDDSIKKSLVVKGNNSLIDPTISDDENIRDDIDEQIHIMQAQNKELQDALCEVITIAKQSQSPDFYKALAAVAKSVNENNRDIISALQVKAEHIRTTNTGNQQPNVIDNSTHQTLIMTTTEAVRLIKEQKANGFGNST